MQEDKFKFAKVTDVTAQDRGTGGSSVGVYALIMVKNESDVIEMTLDSLAGKGIGEIFIYDTGSTDPTLDLCQKWAKENTTPVRIAQGPWVNFSVGRNMALEWLEQSVPRNSWALLLDANDELQLHRDGGSTVAEILRGIEGKTDGCLVTQRWEQPPGEGTVSYKELKLVRTGRNWTWKYPVHEVLVKKNSSPILVATPNIVLYQDRNRETQKRKTQERIPWDYAILHAEHKAKPKDTRIMFYLANTLVKKKDWDSALRVYKMRIATRDGDPNEVPMEAFDSMMRCGQILLLTGKPYEAISWYMRSAAFSKEIGHFRVDGLVEAARIYRHLKQHELSFMLLNYAKDVWKPGEFNPGFNNSGLMGHLLWRELSCAAWSIGRYEEGEKACMKALDSNEPNIDKKIDRENLRWFQTPHVLENAYYINLDERKERDAQTRLELRKILVQNPTRVSATKITPGIIGCLASHIKTLEIAIKNGDDFIAIFEDDVVFKDPPVLLEGIKKIQSDGDWDVLLLGGMNDGGHSPYKNYSAVQTTRCMSCAAYIVRKKYGPKLLMFWTKMWERLHRANNGPLSSCEISLDVEWFKLQREDTFVLLTPLTVTQRVGFSDNANRIISYDDMMLTLEPKNKPIPQDYKLRIESEDDLIVSQSLIPGAGLGLFARVALGPDTILCDYTGDVRNGKQIARAIEAGHCNDYLLKLEDDMFVDPLHHPDVKARYINDAMDPEKNNCIYVLDPPNKKALVVSTRCIYPGEELYVSYGSNYWRSRNC
jgi:glycosyltransferase involved in cell wall biosynthesis